MPHEQLVDPVKRYHKMTVEDFQKNVFGDWVSLFSHMLQYDIGGKLIRWVFDNNLGITSHISPYKHMNSLAEVIVSPRQYFNEYFLGTH